MVSNTMLSTWPKNMLICVKGMLSAFDPTVMSSHLFTGEFVQLTAAEHLRFVEEPIRIERWGRILAWSIADACWHGDVASSLLTSRTHWSRRCWGDNFAIFTAHMQILDFPKLSIHRWNPLALNPSRVQYAKPGVGVTGRWAWTWKCMASTISWNQITTWAPLSKISARNPLYTGSSTDTRRTR